MKKIIVTIISLLPSLAFAQDVIVTNDAETIKVYNTEVGQTHVFYQLEATEGNTSYQSLEKSKVLIIKKEDGTKIDPSSIQTYDTNTSAQVESSRTIEWINEQTSYPNLDLKEYHGLLIAKGNKVFIPHNSSLDYIRAGQNEYYRQIKQDGYWVIVSKPEQAHFVLEYGFCDKGLDFNYVLLRYVEEYIKEPELNCRKEVYLHSSLVMNRTDETIDRNVSNAQYVMHNGVKKLQNEIDSNTLTRAMIRTWTR